MDADAEIDALVVGYADIARDEAFCNRDGAPHGLDDAAKLGDEPIARALDHPSVMGGNRRIDQIAAQRAEPR